MDFRPNVNARLRRNIAGLLLAAVLCGGLQARDALISVQPANAATQSVHDEAVRILNSVQITEYRHRTQIDEKRGVYRCDCSGFVGYVLNRTIAKDDGKGPLHDGRKHPTAMEYEKFFAAVPAVEKLDVPGGQARFAQRAAQKGTVPRGSPWQRVVHLMDARPGDVIAWCHDKPRPGNTGHVVIVDQAPVREPNGLVRVVVIDSTTLPWHDDTGAQHGNGIGRRTMWFTLDKEGRAYGYVRGSRSSKPKVESISVGRALPVVEKRTVVRRAA
ncbi:MAG TPA: hypothetical protein VHE81_13530 [Lacipirellulaceae bacterium]|nr:hypothetical protein [Lacipirellulaceae bacterium]